MKRVILLDADVPAYQFAARGEKTFNWDEEGDGVRVTPPLSWAIDSMLQYVHDLMEELNGDRLVLALSDQDRSANWRLDVLPTYKHNRDASSRPLLFNDIEAALSDHFEFFRKPRLEGDDILGILATSNKIIKGHKVIVSIDKDMKTIPSRPQRGSDNTLVHVPKFGKGVEMAVSESQADWYWMYQTLIGDTTDGYAGLPGCGPVGAYKIIGKQADGATVNELWPLVVEAYLNKKLTKAAKAKLGKDELTEADALQQAQVARIGRCEDWCAKTKIIIPWTP